MIKLFCYVEKSVLSETDFLLRLSVYSPTLKPRFIKLYRYYAPAPVQEIADYVGDSFYLAKVAKQSKADIIVFCGVSFMGESAKILNPDKKVLMPNLTADCPGGTVVDVFVWHKVYGKLTVNLNIFSRLNVKQFIEGVRSGKSTELMTVTGGYHYHTVRAESQEVLEQISKALCDKNYIAPEI